MRNLIHQTALPAVVILHCLVSSCMQSCMWLCELCGEGVVSSGCSSPVNLTLHQHQPLPKLCGHCGFNNLHRCVYPCFCFAVKATITISTVQYIVNASESINITTVVTGNPLPTTIMVEKRDQLTGGYVDYPNTKYSVTGLSTISFTTLLPEDSGQYRACVENSHAAIGCSLFTITVKGTV